MKITIERRTTGDKASRIDHDFWDPRRQFALLEHTIHHMTLSSSHTYPPPGIVDETIVFDVADGGPLYDMLLRELNIIPSEVGGK